jgi:peroxiredoxin
VIEIGEPAPEFELPDTDGDPQALRPPAVVIFTCNHCPYALAWHERLMDVARDYPDVHFYAINPNDAERYPRDSLDAMRERVRADEGWPMPYLHDESQEVARAYGAKTTPDVFVMDSGGALRYRGAPDPDHHDPSLHASWLREALDSVLAGEDVARPETDPVGCSVKWKP